MNYTGARYLSTVLVPNELRIAIRKAKRFFKDKQFDAIVVTGVSGQMFGGPLAYTLKKPIIVVRKKKDNSHSLHSLEGVIYCKRYFIVDDLIDTGKTIKNILGKMKEQRPLAECCGVYLYRDDDTNFISMPELKERFGIYSDSFAGTPPKEGL